MTHRRPRRFAAIVPGLTFALAGDLYLGDPGRIGLDPAVRSAFRKADLAFGNLEGPVCEALPPKRPCRGKPETCYYYKMPASAASTLADWGLDAVSVANNHVFDYGRPCFDETVSHLKAAGIDATGAKGTVSLFERDGIQVAFVAFHTSPWANDIYDLGASLAVIRAAKRRAEVVVVSVHAGAEGEKALRTPDGEEFDFGERRGNVRAFAREAIDAGADLVFGHGPHVLRGLEAHRGRLIAYSLGNLSTVPGFNLRGPRSLGAVLAVKLGAGGQWIEGRVVPTRQDPATGSVALDSTQEAIRLLRSGSGVEVASDGSISLLPPKPPRD